MVVVPATTTQCFTRNVSWHADTRFRCRASGRSSSSGITQLIPVRVGAAGPVRVKTPQRGAVTFHVKLEASMKLRAMPVPLALEGCHTRAQVRDPMRA